MLKLSSIVFLLAATSAALVAAQQGKGASTVEVYIGDVDTANPLPGVQVELPALKLSANTDSFGLAVFVNVKNGFSTISASKRGYETLNENIVIGLSNPVEVSMGMKKQSGAQSLDVVSVHATKPPDFLRPFETRKKMGLGKFVTSPVLDSSSHVPVADFISRRFPGVRAEWSVDRTAVHLARAGFYSVNRKSPPCEARVYIDDILALPSDVAALASGDVEALEFYSNAPPIQYTRAGFKCGVVVIWTKR